MDEAYSAFSKVSKNLSLQPGTESLNAGATTEAWMNVIYFCWFVARIELKGLPTTLTLSQMCPLANFVMRSFGNERTTAKGTVFLHGGPYAAPTTEGTIEAVLPQLFGPITGP